MGGGGRGRAGGELTPCSTRPSTSTATSKATLNRVSALGVTAAGTRGSGIVCSLGVRGMRSCGGGG